MRHLSTDAPLCVTVTLIDGLVYSRAAESHSVNYRSVVCFGRARELQDEQKKRAVMERMTGRCFPGRTLGRAAELSRRVAGQEGAPRARLLGCGVDGRRPWIRHWIEPEP